MPRLPALNFIRSAVSQGMSGNAAYREYQRLAQEQTELSGERWTGMRRNVFQEMYSSTVALRNRVPEAVTAQKDLPAGGMVPIPRPTVRASGYGNWASVFSRQIGSSVVETEYYFQRSDEPLTPEEIERRAQRDFEAATQTSHGTKAGYVFLGTVYTGTEQLIPGAA